MITPVLHLLRLLPFLCGGHRRLAIENLALRQQLAIYKRTAPRPRLRTTDRLFWVGLARVWTGWRRHLVIVTPDTILRWQRRRFCEQVPERAAEVLVELGEADVRLGGRRGRGARLGCTPKAQGRAE